MLRKISTLFLCAIILVTSTALPVKRAEAALPFVLPAAGGVAAGVYVVGALGVAGLATVVGLEHGDEIREHALGVWDTTSSVAQSAIDDSLALWNNGIMPIGNALYDYINSKIPSLMATIAGNLIDGKNLDANLILASPRNIDIPYPLYLEYINGTQIHKFDYRLTITGMDTTKGEIYVRAQSVDYVLQANLTAMTGTEYWNLVSNFETAQQLFAFLSSVAIGSISVKKYDAQFDQIYNDGVSSLRETWTDMRDAGLVLPEAGITAYTGDILVNHNAATGEWVGIDGNVYNPSDLSWQFPIPKTRVATGDIPAGTYVDTPALTGNPAIDTPLINNPAIPKVTTNIKTGVTYNNPDIATDIPINPPITGVPTTPTKKLNLVPLQMSGTTLTEKFPFSIPWDLVRQISVFNVEPEAPEFKIDIQDYLTFPSLNISIPFKMNINLEFLDPVAAIARWGTVIAFDIALILMLRRLLPE